MTEFNLNLDKEKLIDENQLEQASVPEKGKKLTRVANRDNKDLFFRKRQECPLSGKDDSLINYKNPELLSMFISKGKRILPSRITNVCASHQRKLRKAIIRARELGLLAYIETEK